MDMLKKKIDEFPIIKNRSQVIILVYIIKIFLLKNYRVPMLE